MKKVRLIITVLLLSAAMGFPAAVAPLYFVNPDSKENVSADSQQGYWNYLMKYKAWGTKGIVFVGMNIKMPDSSGYFGTATGDFTAGNDQHVIGGPSVIGGNITPGTGTDQFLTGPVRASGNFDAGPNAVNKFFGTYCIAGTTNENAQNGIATAGGTLYQGANASTGACADASVPPVWTSMTVPLIDDDGVTYGAGLSADNATIYIDVPPKTASDSGVYDIYLESISFINDSRLYVRMPEGGRLTRIFLNKNITFAKGSKIQIMYVGAKSVYDYAAKKYTTVDTDVNVVQNSEYAGNLLFYMKGDMSWPAFSQTDTIQGSFISAGTMTLQQQMTLAGQLIATNLSINANFDGSGFRYVPFDPPILDPTALSGGVFIENNQNQEVRMSLDTLASTNVSFNYCFALNETDPAISASILDFDTTATPMKICGTDTGSGVIAEGDSIPKTKVNVNVSLDGLPEGTEYFRLYIFNLAGAVLPNNLREGYFTLSITDVDKNFDPVLNDTALTVPENTVGTFAALAATDKNAESKLTYSAVGGDTAWFSVSSSGKISVKTGTNLDFESHNPVYVINVSVSDGVGGSAVSKVTITVTDVNEAPSIADAKTLVEENLGAGTVIGTFAGTDPDTKNAAYGTLKYTIVSGNGAGDFAIDPATGVVTTTRALDYETTPSYTLKIEASDGSLADTATVAVEVVDVNEPPFVADTAFSVTEGQKAGTVVGVVAGTDPDTKNAAYGTLKYTIVSGNDAGDFAIDPATGKVTTTSVLDYETTPSYTLKVSGSDGTYADTATVTVNVANENENPVLADAKLSVEENAAAGASVGTVTAKDADGDAVTYAISGGTGKSLFVIDSSTGAVTVAKNAVIDYETTGGSVTLTVIAKDAFGGADTVTYTVKIVDVNEPPEITTKSFTVSEDVKAGSTVGTISASDPDTAKANSTLTYTVISDTSGKFTLSGNTLKLDSGETLDYEKDSVYAVTVRVTDGSLSDTATILVHVSNVVESSSVQITRAENRDSVWIDPDTVHTNVTTIAVEWNQDGALKHSTYALHSGVNVIVITYKDPAKDKAGSDTLVVYVSTTVPQVSITVAGVSGKSASGVTIVQQKDASDTASYVKTTTPKIAITATDPVTGKTTGDSLTVKLDTSVTVSSSTYSALVSAVGSVTLAEESSLSSGTDVSHTVIGKNLIKVSYEVTKDGKTYTVSYTTDSSGTRILTDGKELYTVSYTYKEASGRAITVSCETDASGAVVTSTAGAQTVDSEGNRVYSVSYTYTDSYGNSATESTAIIMDVKPPVVVIVSPEDGTKTSSVAIQVKWTVNGIVQDTLTMQGLSNGLNIIIRAYRDKAGNEAADTAYVFLKNGKVIDVSVEDPLVTSDSKTIEKYASSKTTSEEAFGVTVLNAGTGEEEELLTGSTSGKTSAGSGKDPYEGLSGHLGPTLVVTAQTPSINALGNSATLADRVEANGLISLDLGGGWDRRMISVQDYVENYCDSAFAANVDYSDLSSAQLYKNEISLHVWVFTSLGVYVEDYSFKVDASTGDYVDDGGLIHLYFELKPDADGYLYDSKGKKLGTGAYIFNTSVKIRSTLQCELPDKKLGSKRVATDDLLKLWGYRRKAK